MSILPTDSEERKNVPMATGVIDYFPDALAAIAELSWTGNEKHNPGEPLHWSRGKSNDHPDCLMRHFVERGTIDTDGLRHSVKVAWRALAILQLELEEAARVQFTEQDKPIIDVGNKVQRGVVFLRHLPEPGWYFWEDLDDYNNDSRQGPFLSKEEAVVAEARYRLRRDEAEDYGNVIPGAKLADFGTFDLKP